MTHLVCSQALLSASFPNFPDEDYTIIRLDLPVSPELLNQKMIAASDWMRHWFRQVG